MRCCRWKAALCKAAQWREATFILRRVLQEALNLNFAIAGYMVATCSQPVIPILAIPHDERETIGIELFRNLLSGKLRCFWPHKESPNFFLSFEQSPFLTTDSSIVINLVLIWKLMDLLKNSLLSIARLYLSIVLLFIEIMNRKRILLAEGWWLSMRKALIFSLVIKLSSPVSLLIIGFSLLSISLSTLAFELLTFGNLRSNLTPLKILSIGGNFTYCMKIFGDAKLAKNLFSAKILCIDLILFISTLVISHWLTETYHFTVLSAKFWFLPLLDSLLCDGILKLWMWNFLIGCCYCCL